MAWLANCIVKIIIEPGLTDQPLPFIEEITIMKPAPVFTAAFLSLFLSCSIPAVLYSGQQNGNMTETAPAMSFAYNTAGEKKVQGNNLEHLARKDYKICQEHCANEPECKARCAKAYSRRMQALEYQTN